MNVFHKYSVRNVLLKQQTWNNKLLKKAKPSKVSADSYALLQESTHYKYYYVAYFCVHLTQMS